MNEIRLFFLISFPEMIYKRTPDTVALKTLQILASILRMYSFGKTHILVKSVLE